MCVSGDPYASRDNLVRLLNARPLSIERMGTDHYGRTLALVGAGGRDVSCGQVVAGEAIYIEKWDNDHRLAKICPTVRP